MHLVCEERTKIDSNQLARCKVWCVGVCIRNCIIFAGVKHTSLVSVVSKFRVVGYIGSKVVGGVGVLTSRNPRYSPRYSSITLPTLVLGRCNFGRLWQTQKSNM
jgi:hypothetical protein